jgi:S-adenosyl methyltransferase
VSIDGKWAGEAVRTDPVPFDTSVAHSARVYDYWLGGKRFFTGLELAEPGIVQPQQWRPASPPADAEVMLWSGVARKP